MVIGEDVMRNERGAGITWGFVCEIVASGGEAGEEGGVRGDVRCVEDY